MCGDLHEIYSTARSSFDLRCESVTFVSSTLIHMFQLNGRLSVNYACFLIGVAPPQQLIRAFML